MVELSLLKGPQSLGRSGGAGRLVIVSNRVPVPVPNGPAQAGGLAVALECALQAKGGVWFGWSGKTTSEPDPQLQLQTTGNVTYAVMDLSRRDLDEYYHGFANQALWPICHYRLDLVELSARHASGYFRVNELFARRLATMLRPDDTVWIHDYHFIPLATTLRQMGCRNRIGFFLHIPWPPSDVAAALPSYERILRSFAAYDLIGFQTRHDAANFRECLGEAGVGKPLEGDWCEAFGRRFRVGAFPIGIDTEAFVQEARVAEKNVVVRRTRASLEGRDLVIGVDRLDYSKGILQRIDAFSTFLERSPQAVRKRTTMLQVTPKSRSEVPEYARMQREVAEHVGRINGRFGDVDWTPLRYTNKAMSRSSLAGLYRLARCGLVTPLRDGMNLVAKEYVAAQAPDDPGVLVLSRFAGAAQELDGALIVNPFDTDAVAAAIQRAFEMPLEERKARWAGMMETLRANSVTQWSARFLQTLGGDTEAVEDMPEVHAEPWLAASVWTSYEH
jgi:trehalose 6-phosphate synthase